MSRRPLAARYRTALVTGAGGGLGQAFVDSLLAEGVEVWGTSRRPAALPSRERFHAVRFELAEGPSAAEALVAEVERASGGLDLLVHNAGYGVFGAFLGQSLAVWHRQVEDLLGVSLSLNHAVLKAISARRRGAIVNVTSMAVEFPIPCLAGYNVAKAGLAALTATLMLEAVADGVALIDFRPGDYRTKFNDAMFAGATPTHDVRSKQVAARLESLLARAPAPEQAARDLLRALCRGRSGVVRSGSLLQTTVAPLWARLAPEGLRRAVLARYFSHPLK